MSHLVGLHVQGRVVDVARQRSFYGALKKSPKTAGHKTELEWKQTYV